MYLLILKTFSLYFKTVNHKIIQAKTQINYSAIVGTTDIIVITISNRTTNKLLVLVESQKPLI